MPKVKNTPEQQEKLKQVVILAKQSTGFSPLTKEAAKRLKDAGIQLYWEPTPPVPPIFNLKPLGNRVAIIADNAESITKSGIIIPDSAKEAPLTGTIAAIGPEVHDCKVGDKIVYGKYIGVEITYQDKQYLLMRNTELYCTI